MDRILYKVLTYHSIEHRLERRNDWKMKEGREKKEEGKN